MLQTMNNNTTTTTTKSCHNIFNDLVNGEYITRNTLGVFNQSFFAIEKGIVRELNCGDFCCPDCGDIYYFGRSTAFSQSLVPNVFTENDLTPSGKLECCINYIGLDITESGLNSMGIPGDNDTIISVGYDLCTTGNFNTCLTQLQSILAPGQYNDLLVASGGGIVEYSTIGGSSMLCKIITQLQLSPVYTPQLLYDYLFKLISDYTGIVISCNFESIHGTGEQSIVGGSFDRWSIFGGFGGAVPVN